MGSGLAFLALFVIAAAGASGQLGNLAAPDTIFYNGKIVTVDAGSNIQQAFAVKGEEFLVAGTTAKIRAMAGKNTRLVDLRGSTVIPGLADDHHHVYASARVTWRGVDMVGVTTLAEMSNRLRRPWRRPSQVKRCLRRSAGGYRTGGPTAKTSIRSP